MNIRFGGNPLSKSCCLALCLSELVRSLRLTLMIRWRKGFEVVEIV